MKALVPGVCRHCGCRGESCSLADGEKCGWEDDDRTVCNAPGCMRAERARARAEAARRSRSKYQGWGYGAIVADLRREQRRKRRRKGKAA